jgi:aspartate/tyrosine/aromatic aminotransferase
MFTGATQESTESMWTAFATCAADQRPQKIDLLVGVYKDKEGQTPTMKAIRLAEGRLWQQQATKNYLAVTGRDAFSSAILDLVLGSSEAHHRAYALQTVGGSGALRLLLELVKRSTPAATIWMSNPGFPGHLAVANGVGLGVRFYPYEVTSRGTLRADVVLDTLSAARAGDVVILDASCHNPTGVDLAADAWHAAAEVCAQRGLVPLVDVAYQGLAHDVVADVTGIATLTSVVEHALVSVSCSKTFGVYRERTGAAIVIAPTPAAIPSIMQSLVQIAFSLYAVPPDHGAALVEAVLRDASLRTIWQEELLSMSEYLRHCRQRFAGALENASALGLEYIRNGHGIFSMLPLNSRQMRELRERFAIHGLQNGRVNLTGVTDAQLQAIGAAVRAVI